MMQNLENPTVGRADNVILSVPPTPEVPPQPRRSSSGSDNVAFPEKKITWFAFKLASLEKAASGLGKLAFLWATVVVLGGFAGNLKTVDFWCVTLILLTEGVRIFSRSQEVVWHHENTLESMATLGEEARRLRSAFYNICCSISICKIFGCWRYENREEDSDHDDYQRKSWSLSMVRFLYCLQLLSASAIVGLSLFRLVRHNYIDVVSDKDSSEKKDSGNDARNLKSSLIILYAVYLAEAFLLVLEMMYWEMSVKKLLTEVNVAYGFDFDGRDQLHTVRRFLYDTYSRCVNGNIFDYSKMEFVSYSVELLQSSTAEEQLTGARVLSKLARNKRFAERTLRAIGTMRDVVERLIDMLNFKFKNADEEIRKAAAEIISKLVENERNCIRLTAITGLMESVATLLYSNDSNQGGFVSLGLTIVKKLADERSNRHKINSSRGLIPKIISLTDLEPNESQLEINKFQLGIKTDKKLPFATEVVELALEIVKTLASTTGSTGTDLRERILGIVFAISNLRNVVLWTKRDDLRIRAIETLTFLAYEHQARESIGRTGGILRKLFSLFFEQINNRDNYDEKEKLVNSAGEVPGLLSLESEPTCRIMMSIDLDNNYDEKEKLVNSAGEVLGLLSLESEPTCRIMMSIDLDNHPNLLKTLIPRLKDDVRRIHAARILRNLLEYANANCVSEITNPLAEQVLMFAKDQHSCQHTHEEPMLLKFAREEHSFKHTRKPIGPSEKHSCDYQEAAIGLAARFMTKWDFDRVQFPELTIELLWKLVKVFQSHRYPLKMVPNVRRYSIEVLIAILKRDKAASLEQIPELVVNDLKKALKGVMETTSDWEYYSAFSGSKGLNRHSIPILSLAQEAMELLSS